jgi:hypothetical protein
VALRDHAAPIGIFLCFAWAAPISLGRVPCGVQDRVRERQEGLFAANRRGRLWNDRLLVAPLLLVLSLVGWQTPRLHEPCTPLAQRRARQLSAPVYGWFTEGFDTRDLKDAKRLHEELAA